MKARFEKRRLAREKRKLASWDRRWRGLHTYYADRAKLIAVIEGVRDEFCAWIERQCGPQQRLDETDDEFRERLKRIYGPSEVSVVSVDGNRMEFEACQFPPEPPNENGPPAPLPGGPDQQGN